MRRESLNFIRMWKSVSVTKCHIRREEDDSEGHLSFSQSPPSSPHLPPPLLLPPHLLPPPPLARLLHSPHSIVPAPFRVAP